MLHIFEEIQTVRSRHRRLAALRDLARLDPHLLMDAMALTPGQAERLSRDGEADRGQSSSGA